MNRMNKQKISFTYKGLGHTPGVEVGDSFNYRTKMFIVGLHLVLQGSIASVTIIEKEKDVKVACSVVVLGGYEDDVDCGEIIEYCGHGENDYKGDKRLKKDQELKRRK